MRLTHILAIVTAFLRLDQSLASDDCNSVSERGECEWKDQESADCSVTPSRCQASALYAHGASAQAYKPGSPIKTFVCDYEKYENEYSKVASWPYSRSSRRPTLLQWKVELVSCQSSDQNQCCCQSLTEPSTMDAVVEVWQTRPDGTYSSLRPGVDDGDCRGRIPFMNGSISSFTTWLSGSTGILHGLGPSRWDFASFGPPVLHMLVQAPDHSPLLVDIPVLTNNKGEQQAFSWTDWRGSAWVGSKEAAADPYEIVSWTTDLEGIIQVHVRLHLIPSSNDTADMCPSFVWGHPQAFFREPMAVCAAPLLDWFAL